MNCSIQTAKGTQHCDMYSKKWSAPEAEDVCNDMHSGVFGIRHHEASLQTPPHQVQLK